MKGSYVLFSSNTDNGLNAGRFYLNANNATSNANSNIDSGDLLHKIIVTFRTEKVKQRTILHYVLVEKSKAQE